MRAGLGGRRGARRKWAALCAAGAMTFAPALHAQVDRMGEIDLAPTAAARAEIEQLAELPISGFGTARIVRLHKRGNARLRLGRYAAAVADLREAADLKPPEEAQADGWGTRLGVEHDLVMALWHAGDLVAALEFQKARVFPPNRLASKHWLTAELQHSLGLLEDAEQSVQAARRALLELRHNPRLRAPWGDKLAPVLETGWTALVDNTEAEVLELRGRLSEAEGPRRLALGRARELTPLVQALPQNHVWRWRYAPTLKAWSQQRLAVNLVAQGRSAEAEVLLRDTLAESLQVSGLGHGPVRMAMLVLGKMRLQQGRLVDAEQLLRATLTQAEAAEMVPHSPALADLRAQLGTTWVLQGRDVEAVQMFERRAAPWVAAASPGGAPPGLRIGAHIDWAYALARNGRAEAAQAMYAELIDAEQRKPFADALLLAQARGLQAVARLAPVGRVAPPEQGERAAMLRELAAVMPVLLAHAEAAARNEAEDFVNQWRLKIIAEGYLRQLADCAADACGVPGLDVPAEAFRVAEAVRESQVQRAMSTGLARARLPDARLQALAREDQVLQVRSRALRELGQRLLLRPPEQRLNKIVADLQRDLARLDAERRNVQDEIARQFPAYAALVRPSLASLATTQNLLPPGEALVALYVSEAATYVWTVTRAAAAFRALPRGRAELAATVQTLREQLEFGEGAPKRFNAAAAHALYRDLLAPDAGLWAKAQLLHVVPHGALAQLPLAMLVTREPRGGLPPRWLIEDVALDQLPTVSALHSLRRGPPVASAQLAFVGFGDPVFAEAAGPAPGVAVPVRAGLERTGVRRLISRKSESGVEASAWLQALTSGAGAGGGNGAGAGGAAGLPVALPQATLAGIFSNMPPLPDTAQELRDIADAVGADPARDLHLQLAASERSVKALDLSNYRVVAFATHGLMAGDVDGLDQPALALSNPQLTREDDDGLLTMGEVLGLKLNADWVVLSACNTASADGSAGEALSGLGRAFFFAGARSLLVSNWPVETNSARLLTTGVFQAQAADATVGRAEALRRSIRALQKQPRYAHPIFWAPFVLVGDGAGR